MSIWNGTRVCLCKVLYFSSDACTPLCSRQYQAGSEAAVRMSACSICGGGTRAPGGALCLHVGCPGLGTRPPPTARPWGRRPGPAARFPWARGVWAWGPVTNPTAHALACWVSWGGGCCEASSSPYCTRSAHLDMQKMDGDHHTGATRLRSSDMSHILRAICDCMAHAYTT